MQRCRCRGCDYDNHDNCEHIKELKKEVLAPIAKIIDDFCCGRIENSIDALNRINKIIYEQTKGKK